MGKDLKDKAINIKGKKYVLVSDRVIYFNEQYPKGAIKTKLISDPDSDNVIVKAIIEPNDGDVRRRFTGYSQAIKGDGVVNKTAALENAETSAVGRALAMMGIGVLDSIASVDEINKATGSTGQRQTATQKQINWMLDEADKVLMGKPGVNVEDWLEKLLTMPVTQVPIFKVKEAVDLIRKQSTTKLGTNNVNVSEDDLKKIDEGTLLDELPY